MNEIIEKINTVMEISCDQLDLNTELSSISEWDSFNSLMLISEFEDKYNIKFTAQELDAATTIQKIITLVESKQEK
ncbi:MAG: acyl carrier protein [Candidatus Woesearchaeota archaeon]|jgi:acyl carrier protein